MALLHESVDFKKLDVRLIERNIARGVLTTAELDQSLQQLPDDAENADWISVESLTEGGNDAKQAHSNGKAGSHTHALGQA